jgi:hypothetical protein
MNPVRSLTFYIPTIHPSIEIPCTPESPNLFLRFRVFPNKMLSVFLIICPIPYLTQPLWSDTSSVSFHTKYMLRVYFFWPSSVQSFLVPGLGGPVTTFSFFPRLFHVLKLGLLVGKKRGLFTNIGHSPATGGDSSGHSLTNWPFPPHTHTSSSTPYFCRLGDSVVRLISLIIWMM